MSLSQTKHKPDTRRMASDAAKEVSDDVRSAHTTFNVSAFACLDHDFTDAFTSSSPFKTGTPELRDEALEKQSQRMTENYEALKVCQLHAGL